MRISYNWLKRYVATDLTAEKAAEILTDIGLEVESIEKVETIKGGLEGLVIGEVLTCEKHPDADKLSVTTVEYGEGPVQIVCGAPNVAKGLKVVVATVGATLYPSDSDECFKIKKSKIRGVESLGMLCAEDEIGLGASHAGIMELDADATVGMGAKEYFKVEEDYALEIGLTPNRVDAASHIGTARDLVAYFAAQGQHSELIMPSVDDFKIDSSECKGVEVEVVDTAAAPHYMGVTMRGVEVKPSPEWLQNALRLIGITPKNNIVDITNFVLHETGQPLHAFDAGKIEGDKIVVRCAAEGEKFTTLDGVERTLSDKDLMICSAERPMCLAGIFGGEDSGVSDATTDIFIESAYFNPVSIRKSAKRHQLSTDASFRYERGIDPNMAGYALKRAALLVKECAGGDIVGDVTDILNMDLSGFEVELSISRVEKLIGKAIGKETIMNIITGLDMIVKSDDGDRVVIEVPAYRVDVKRDVDVIEDILRIYGYNNIEIPQSVKSTLSHTDKYSKPAVIEQISQLLTHQGFNEIMSNSLTKASYYEGSEIYPLDKCVKIINPLSIDLNVMRQTLLYNSMEALLLNTNRRRTNVKFYEVGNCYSYNAAAKEEGGLAPYQEATKLSMLISGDNREQSWMGGAQRSSIFILKHYAQILLKRFGIEMEAGTLSSLVNEIYKDGATLTFRKQPLLEMGVLAKGVKDKFDIKNEVYFLELNVDTLVSIAKTVKVAAKELSKFPEVKRDLSLLVDDTTSFAALREVAFKTEKKLLKSVSLFDVYEGDKLPEGKKSYALSFVLEDTTATLTDKVIDKIMNNLVMQFEKQCKAEIRK